MIYLLLMTLAGTILFVLYSLGAFLFKEHINDRMKYAALKLVLLVYVLPLMWLKIIYNKLLAFFIPRSSVQENDLLMSVAEVSTDTESYTTPDYRLRILVISVWVGIAVLLLLRYGIIYLRKMHMLRKVADACRSERAVAIVDRLRKEYHVRRKIDVLISRGNGSPYTVGVFKPLIVLRREFEDDEMEWILRHEMTHIIRWDVGLTLLVELVGCIYWFNPFFYVFKQQFEGASELSCDATVLLKRPGEDRSAYAKILIKCATDHGEMTFSNALVHKDENINERVMILMNSRKMKHWEKAVAISALVVFVLADSLVAFAYPNVYHVEDVTEAEEAVAPVAGGGSLWTNNDSWVKFDEQVFEVVYDNQYIDEAGTIIPLNLDQPLVFCLGHDLVQGYVQTHEKNDDSGCTVKVFNAKRCSYCDTVIIESVYSTTDFTKCNH